MGTKPSILLVHGLWADGSCWNEIIPTLQAEGYDVIAVQNPLTSLADDVAAVNRALARLEGPTVLVGHSWGGFVISEAGNHTKVKSLVYVAALAPDSGEDFGELTGKVGHVPVEQHFQIEEGFIWVSKEGVQECFAGDLPAEKSAVIYATQGAPSAGVFSSVLKEAAWRKKPSWYVIANDDQTVSPELQYFMSNRMGATTMVLASSHVAMISHPKEVLEQIRAAART